MQESLEECGDSNTFPIQWWMLSMVGSLHQVGWRGSHQQHRALSSWYEGESGMQDGTGRPCDAFLVYTDCSSIESPQCVVENHPSWLWLPWHCTSLSVCPLALEQWCHAWRRCQDQLWLLTLNEMGLEWECVVLLGWHLPGGGYGLQDQAYGGKGVCNWMLTHGRSRGGTFPI